MKRRKRTKPGPPTKEERDFQQRVRKAIKRSSGTLYAFEKTRGIPKATVRGWLKEKTQSGDPVRPRLPYSPQLLAFARVTGSNLHHLLTGDGSEYVGELQPRPELAASLRQHVVAALASRAGLPDAAVDFIVSPPEELLQEVVAHHQAKAAEYPAILRGAIAQATAQGRGKKVHKAIAELRHWLGIKPGAGERFTRQDFKVQVRTVDASGVPTPPGTYGRGVLHRPKLDEKRRVEKDLEGRVIVDEGTVMKDQKGRLIVDRSAYLAEAAARQAKAGELSPAERAYLEGREQSLAAGQSARREEVKARRRASRSTR